MQHRRALIALMALVLLAIGIALWLDGATGAGAVEAQAQCLKLGVLCALVWLAYPELMKLPGWLFPALFCTALAAYRWRWLFALVPIIAAAGWLLQPRRTRRGTARRGRPRDRASPATHRSFTLQRPTCVPLASSRACCVFDARSRARR